MFFSSFTASEPKLGAVIRAVTHPWAWDLGAVAIRPIAKAELLRISLDILILLSCWFGCFKHAHVRNHPITHPRWLRGRYSGTARKNCLSCGNPPKNWGETVLLVGEMPGMDRNVQISAHLNGGFQSRTQE